MSNFNANNSGDGENPVLSALNMSISNQVSPSPGGGTESVTGSVQSAPTYDEEAIGAALLSQEDDDGVGIYSHDTGRGTTSSIYFDSSFR